MSRSNAGRAQAGRRSSDVLAVRPDLHVIELDGETVIYQPVDGSLHLLDGPGTAIWQRIDGARTIAEISACCAREFGTNVEIVQRDVLAFFGRARVTGLVTACPSA